MSRNRKITMSKEPSPHTSNSSSLEAKRVTGIMPPNASDVLTSSQERARQAMSSGTGSRGSGASPGAMIAQSTIEVVKEAGGSDADLSFLKYHQDILDTFRPALRALVSGLINYKFEHHDHVILPYYRTYMYGGEAYVLYHEADKAEKDRSPLERVPFRRPLDMDIFVPIDVKDWSEPHRLQRKQELFIQDLWKIWGSQEVHMLAEMAMRSLNNRGFDLTGPYMSTAVSALFLKDPGMRRPMGAQMQFHPSQIDNDRMYRKVCLEYYDATADHMVTLCEFQLKPRTSWGDFDEVYTMLLNPQDFTVKKMERGPIVIKNKRAVLPPLIRVPSVKKVIRVACTGVSGNRAVQIREVDGVVQLHAPQDRCRNPNPQGIPTVPIKAVTDLSRRDWFLDTIVTPLMKDDPEVLQDVRQLSRQMQKEQNIFPELGALQSRLSAQGTYQSYVSRTTDFPMLPRGTDPFDLSTGSGGSYANNE